MLISFFLRSILNRFCRNFAAWCGFISNWSTVVPSIFKMPLKRNYGPNPTFAQKISINSYISYEWSVFCYASTASLGLGSTNKLNTKVNIASNHWGSIAVNSFIRSRTKANSFHPNGPTVTLRPLDRHIGYYSVCIGDKIQILVYQSGGFRGQPI